MKKEKIALIVVSVALIISLIFNITYLTKNNKINNTTDQYLVGTWKSNKYKLTIFKNNKFEYTYYYDDNTKINTIFGYLENNTLIYEKIRHYQIEGVYNRTVDKETTGYLYITKLSDKTINVYGGGENAINSKNKKILLEEIWKSNERSDYDGERMGRIAEEGRNVGEEIEAPYYISNEELDNSSFLLHKKKGGYL